MNQVWTHKHASWWGTGHGFRRGGVWELGGVKVLAMAAPSPRLFIKMMNVNATHLLVISERNLTNQDIGINEISKLNKSHRSIVYKS